MIKELKKRNGELVSFNKEKISIAISKANNGLFNDEWKLSNEDIEFITDEVVKELELLEDTITVEDVQDIVEKELVKNNNYELAKSYMIYRYIRTKFREQNKAIVEKVKQRVQGKICLNSNANVDERSFSGKEKEVSSDISKSIAIDFNGLSEKTAKAHREMRIYQHDLEKAIYGIHNCLNINLPKIFKEGFSTRNGDVRPPSSFSSACQLVAVSMQCASQVQFGGVGTIHFDYDLAPFVKKSFVKLFTRSIIKNTEEFNKLNILEMSENEFDEYTKSYIDKYLDSVGITKEDITIDNEEYLSYKTNPKYYKEAIYELMIEGRQSCQALYHNLNTLESRQGSQVPFTSINLGRDTSTEGRLITKWIFEASLNGIGKLHQTSIFPISIFSYKQGVNANPEDPNYDLKKLAIKSLSKRVFPNLCNGDWSEAHEDPNDIDTIMSTMGCRTMTGFDINGLGYKKQGRGNAVPNTIILPKLGIEHGICLGKRETPDIDGFWKDFEDTLNLCEYTLLERFKLISEQNPCSAPFLYKNGIAAETDKCKDDVYETMKHFTLAIGYIGIAELCQAMFGKDHADGDQEVYDFALSVVKRINTFAKEASERNHLNFSCYATPAEGLCRTALSSLREQYGVLEGVTSREYLTNSHHVPVWKEVSIYDKLKLEAPFTKYNNGGTITYVELESTFMDNQEAIEDIIDYAFKELDIPYLAFNFPIDTCLDCGYQSEINVTCPVCGSDKIQRLRRVTGYLTVDYNNFNYGKKIETEERVKHSAYTDLSKDHI